MERLPLGIPFKDFPFTLREKPSDSLKMVVVCGPTGVGKTSVIDEFLQRNPDFSPLHGYTDRPKRSQENKNCISKEEFTRMFTTGEFLFSFESYGNRYGTTKDDFEKVIRTGKVVIMDLPLEHLGECFDTMRIPLFVVCLLPPSVLDFHSRLSERQERMNHAQRELNMILSHQISPFINNYLINKGVEEVVSKIEDLLANLKA